MPKTPTMSPGQKSTTTGKTTVMSPYTPTFSKLRGGKRRGGKSRGGRR